eukprot:2479601-Prymnesium_polylepis.1
MDQKRAVVRVGDRRRQETTCSAPLRLSGSSSLSGEWIQRTGSHPQYGNTSKVKLDRGPKATIFSVILYVCRRSAPPEGCRWPAEREQAGVVVYNATARLGNAAT